VAAASGQYHSTIEHLVGVWRPHNNDKKERVRILRALPLFYRKAASVLK